MMSETEQNEEILTNTDECDNKFHQSVQTNKK